MRILTSVIAPSPPRLILIRFPAVATPTEPVLVPHWVIRGRVVYRWLEHPIRRTAHIVKFAAIMVAIYALALVVLL